MTADIEAAFAAQATIGTGTDARLIREMAEYRHRFDWDQVRPFELPTSKASTAAGAITLTDETWGPRTGRVWDFRRITVAGLAAGTPGASTTTSGTLTSPTVGQTITSQALAAGTYTVAWQVSLSGTLGTIDANDFIVKVGTTQVAASLNSAVAGTYPQPALTIVVPAGGATLFLNAANTGTVGSVYGGQLTVTPVAAADAVTVYKAGSPTAGGAQLQTAIDVVTGAAAAGTVGNALYTAKGALILQHGDYIAITGTVTSAQVVVSGAGIDVRVDCLPAYLA